MKTYLIIIISLFSFYGLYSQDINQTLEIANKNYFEKNYNSALKSYRRVQYFDTNNVNYHIFSKIADCYYYENKFEDALFYYDLAFNFEINDSLKKEYSFKKILIYTLQKNIFFANRELLSLDDTLSIYFYKQKEFYLGIINFEQDSINISKNNFKNCIEDTIKKLIIDSLYNSVNLKHPKPKIAYYLSFFPGAGQLYLGNYKDAANSFLLSATFMTLFLYTSFNYSIIDAVISVMPYFYRYYVGGINKSKNFAETKKKDKKQKLLNNILKVYK